MDDLANADQMLTALRRAVMLGVDLADAADIYAWGLTREFGPVRTAASAHVAAAAERADYRPAPSWHTPLRKVAGDDR